LQFHNPKHRTISHWWTEMTQEYEQIATLRTTSTGTLAADRVSKAQADKHSSANSA
jgi:hypothetical protein